MFTCMHAHMEARGQCQVAAIILHPPFFWRQSLSLNRQLTNLSKLQAQGHFCPRFSSTEITVLCPIQQETELGS